MSRDELIACVRVLLKNGWQSFIVRWKDEKEEKVDGQEIKFENLNFPDQDIATALEKAGVSNNLLTEFRNTAQLNEQCLASLRHDLYQAVFEHKAPEYR